MLPASYSRGSPVAPVPVHTAGIFSGPFRCVWSPNVGPSWHLVTTDPRPVGRKHQWKRAASMTHQTQRARMPGQRERSHTGPRTTYVGIPQRLTAHQPFRGNSLSAGLPIGMAGRLAGEDRAAYTVAYRAGAIIYEVRSFYTPIAWLYRAGYTADGPVLRVYAVTEWFSVTTAKHQRLVAAYLRP